MLKFKNILITLAIVLGISTTVYAADEVYKLVRVYYPIMTNGSYSTANNSEILNYNGRTYMSIRAIAESLGIPITWDNEKVQVKITTCDVDKLKESCVEIYVSNGTRDIEQGSGVLIGYNQILTVDHVTNKGTSYRILYNGSTTTQASLKLHNSGLDMSILDPVNEDVKPCKIGDSDEVKIGDKVVLISSPKQSKNVVNWGTVMDNKFEFDGITCINASTSGGQGSSGGALFNSKGELIGICDAGDGANSYSIPINDIRKALN